MIRVRIVSPFLRTPCRSAVLAQVNRSWFQTYWNISVSPGDPEPSKRDTASAQTQD